MKFIGPLDDYMKLYMYDVVTFKYGLLTIRIMKLKIMPHLIVL